MCAQERPARRLRRGRRLRARRSPQGGQGRRQDRRQDLPGRDRHQGQPVQSQPRRRGGQGTDPRGQGRADAGRPRRPRPPIRCATQCEIEQMPCISSVAPWQPYFFGRQAIPAIRRAGSRSTTPTIISGAWKTSSASSPACGSRSPTNKSVGALFPNDGDGNAWGDKVVGFPPVLDKQGYKLTDPGRFQNLTDDFSAQIAAFKAAKAEIVTGVVIPPDFTTFWNQAQQKGLKPKVVSVARRCCSRSRWRRWGRTATTSPPKCGGPRATPTSRASPASAPADSPRLRAGDRQAMDPADRLRAFAVRGGHRLH